MDGKKLIKMANEIATFFAAEPERSVALEGIATHLRKFWEPRMRREILQIAAQDGNGLSPLAREAVGTLREVPA
jgi:formate dehydrogenase subunit delta